MDSPSCWEEADQKVKPRSRLFGANVGNQNKKGSVKAKRLQDSPEFFPVWALDPNTGNLRVGVGDRNGVELPFGLTALGMLFNLQLPLTEAFECDSCHSSSPTVLSALAKQSVLIEVLERCRINLNDGSGLQQVEIPYSMRQEEWEPSLAAVGIWGRFCRDLVERAWTKQGAIKVRQNDVVRNFRHCSSSFFGGMKKEPLTPEIAQQFLILCTEVGLLDEGDPGKGGEMFPKGLDLDIIDDPMKRAHAVFILSSFVMSKRPTSWRGKAPGYARYCADCWQSRSGNLFEGCL